MTLVQQLQLRCDMWSWLLHVLYTVHVLAVRYYDEHTIPLMKVLQSR
jgi:hypothetical protein